MSLDRRRMPADTSSEERPGDAEVKLASKANTSQEVSVECSTCERRCGLAPGATGFCKVRRNVDGEVKLLTYGRLTSCNISPIEIKPFHHFWPGTRHLSLGSAGCNFRCAGCQNWTIACPEDPVGETSIDLPPERAVELAREIGADGISFTYNEPTVWLEYVLDCARLAKDAGLLTNLVTNGYMTAEALDSLSECIDAIRIDVKGTQESYDAITSGVRAELVRRNAERSRKLGLHLEIVTNLVPGVSDGEDVLRDIARWIAAELGPETPWHITRFHPARRLLALAPTSLEAIERGLGMAREEGLVFVYAGNVPGHEAESTWCPECGALLVKRMGRGVSDVRLDDGCCPAFSRAPAEPDASCPECRRRIPMTGEARVTKGGPVGPVRVL